MSLRKYVHVLASSVLIGAGCEGPRGEAGEAGEAGPQGAPGEKGDKGDPGATGATGPQGPAGKDGTNGTNGTNGTDGVDGKDGANGTNGIDGTDGANGLDGAPGATDPIGPTGFAPSRWFVSLNGATNAGEIQVQDEKHQRLVAFTGGGNEGLAFDRLGNLYHAGDLGATATPAIPGRLAVSCNAPSIGEGSTFDADYDRLLGGPGSTQTGLVAPKGLALAHKAGLVLIANNGAARISVFGSAAAGDVAPVATTALAANPWDLVYDEPRDRLFVALVNGAVAVFDDYLTNFGAAGATRTITPADANGVKLSANLHGIAYRPDADQLVVSDVGALTTLAQGAAFNSDGAIFVIDRASTANGNVVPTRHIAGPATRLGNPVDLELDGLDARVTEKANDLVLVFRNVVTGASGDIAPDLAQPVSKAEALAAAPVPAYRDDVSDIDDPAAIILSVGITQNPAAGAGTGILQRLGYNLANAQTTFDAQRSLENITYDRHGDAWVTFDDGTNTVGGVAVIGRFARARNGGTFSTTRDRVITGQATGLVAPKGLEIVDSLGLVLVAESNATTPSVRAFSTCATGNATPVQVTSLVGVGQPWDLDYDPIGDRLFVALTNGKVAVFDSYSRNSGSAGPSRTFTPRRSDAVLATNLHGIVYVADGDLLILSDVGLAASPTDGRLYLVEGASLASGTVDVRVDIAGPDSKLGNPVDIAFDGAHLFVAEKSNSAVLRWDFFADLASGDVAPDRQLTVAAPESVGLVPSWVGAR